MKDAEGSKTHLCHLVQQTQCDSYTKIYKEGKKMHYLNAETLDRQDIFHMSD